MSFVDVYIFIFLYFYILLMYLLIDYREQDFIKKLSEFTFIENDVLKTITINNKDVHFKITNLIVGDYIIKANYS
jgi:hypothetical protein